MHTYDREAVSGIFASLVSPSESFPKAYACSSLRPRLDAKTPRPRSSSDHPASPRALRTTANRTAHCPFNYLRALRARVSEREQILHLSVRAYTNGIPVTKMNIPPKKTKYPTVRIEIQKSQRVDCLIPSCMSSAVRNAPQKVTIPTIEKSAPQMPIITLGGIGKTEYETNRPAITQSANAPT